MESSAHTTHVKQYVAREKYGHRLVTDYVDEHFVLIRRDLLAGLLVVSEAIRKFDGRS